MTALSQTSGEQLGADLKVIAAGLDRESLSLVPQSGLPTISLSGWPGWLNGFHRWVGSGIVYCLTVAGPAARRTGATPTGCRGGVFGRYGSRTANRDRGTAQGESAQGL